MESSDEWCPSGLFLGLMLFSIFINDTESGIECTLSKFTAGTKLSGVVGKREGWDAIQGHLDKCEKWAHKNLMKLQDKGPAHGSGQSQIGAQIG